MKTKLFASTVLALCLVITLLPILPGRASPAEIKIGVMGPMGLIQGDGMKEGAILAKDWLLGGVVDVGGTPYEIKLVFSDEFQGMSDGTAETGRLAMEYLIASGCDYVAGGFRSESVFGAREVAMDYSTIYLTTGAATDNIIACAGGAGACGACVRCDYARYKYVFRITPVNSTALVPPLTGKWFQGKYGFISNVLARLADIYDPYSANPQVPYAAVVEDLVWAAGFKSILSNVTLNYVFGIPGPPFTEVGLADMYLGSTNNVKLQQALALVYGAWPPIPAGYAKLVSFHAVSPTATDLDAQLSAIKASGARLIIQIISAEKAGRAFTTSWKKLGVNAVPIGINVIEQMGEAWVETAGDVEFECGLVTTGTRTPVTQYSVGIYDAYMDMWGRKPIYTAWGAYLAVSMLATALNRAGTLNNDDIIPELEKYDETTGTGHFMFTGPNPGHNGDYSDYDPNTGGNQPYPYNGTINSANPTLKGTLHDISTVSWGATWTDGLVRALVGQWQQVVRGPAIEVTWPSDRPYSIKFRIPSGMYPLFETDLVLDGAIGPADMGIVAAAWQTNPGDLAWALDADMDSNGLIDIADVSRVAKDWNKLETLPYVP